MIEGSTGLDGGNKPYAIQASEKALKDSLNTTHPNALVYHLPALTGNFRVRYTVKSNPLVSLIVLTRDGLEVLKVAIDSILEKTSYQNYEILIIDNGSVKAETLAYFEEIRDLWSAVCPCRNPCLRVSPRHACTIAGSSHGSSCPLVTAASDRSRHYR